MFDMAGQLIELLLTTAQEQDYEIDRTVCVRVWDKHLEENKAKWKERSKKGVVGGGEGYKTKWTEGRIIEVLLGGAGGTCDHICIVGGWCAIA